MARVNIDGKDYDLPDGQNLLHACLSEQLDLPYFCWHPAMGSVGSCRLCAVLQYRDEADTRGRLQMACMMTVEDGLRIGIGTSDGEPSRPAAFAADFRRQVIEWLMENHPHDCPVCEEGGECHLQDMTVMTGHSMRRYGGMKRTWENQYLGPFVGHEMNRCITCYRCVRYYRDYAGGTDLDAFGSKSHMFFGRAEDGVLMSEFAGNLVEVCPTGVFTDKPFSKVYTRKWDLQSAPSICPHCSVGCNTFPAERYGVLKRVHNRYHGEVNGYFLCDRGRYGSHFVNHDKRIRHTGVRAEDGVFEAPGRDEAVTAVAERLQDADVIGIGSPRASMGANFALKQLVGADGFCTGMADDEAATMAAMLDAYRGGGFKIPSLTDIETADAVLILGEDISNTAARMALAVRQAAHGVAFEMAKAADIPGWQDAGVRGHAQHAKSPLFIASVGSTRIDDLAAATRHGDATDLARAGFGIA
ncbi:MAG: NADH-quinone oxidoreductase subunit G, partial [Gammaproteobacteria bacterium]|nr:NADH-quinone oxidoreductase subunit G [Gammaproteobacteria bacterium]